MYLESYGLVYNYVRYRMGDVDEAEDVVAEAFMLAARSFHKFDSRRAKFSTWVTKIAINCMNSHYRKKHPTVTLEEVSEKRALESDAHGAVDDRALVEQLLGVLNDEERNLVLMKYHEDKRNIDIAQELNMNASTVSTKLACALKKMRAVLERSE